MKVRNFNSSALHLTLQKLLEDWGENFRECTVLSQWAEVISVDHENLTRVIRSHLYLFPENDGFDFARNIPSSFVTEKCVWTLTWHDAAAFGDPSGFDESDYDYENIDIDGVDWDDPDLPADVFASAIAQIDWWATGECLEDWVEDGEATFIEAPARLRPYLQNALALYRRQMLGRWGYLKYLLSRPKLLWHRVRNRGLWQSITADQLGSFSFHWGR